MTVHETIWGGSKYRPRKAPKAPKSSGGYKPRHPGGRTCGMFALPLLGVTIVGLIVTVQWIVGLIVHLF